MLVLPASTVPASMLCIMITIHEFKLKMPMTPESIKHQQQSSSRVHNMKVAAERRPSSVGYKALVG